MGLTGKFKLKLVEYDDQKGQVIALFQIDNLTSVDPVEVSLEDLNNFIPSVEITKARDAILGFNFNLNRLHY